MREIQQYLVTTIDEATLHETGCVHAKNAVLAKGHISFSTRTAVVSPPLDYEREPEIIRERGACDAKGALTAMATAFSRVTPETGRVSLLVSPDEEATRRGLLEYLSDGIAGDFGIVGDPSGLNICFAARGHYDFVIDCYGESAHGATPGNGTNATVCAAEAITRLADLPRLEDDRLGTNSVTPTLIDGGHRPNQVPAYTRFVVDYRTVPAETRLSFHRRM